LDFVSNALLMKEVSILIVDDHQIIIDGIKSLLHDQDEFRVAGEACNGKEAIEFLKLFPVNIVLLDIDMPVMNGIEATKKIKAEFDDIRVIILTMHNESGLINSLVASGADGYILKNSDQHELILAIQKVANGQQYFSSDVTMTLLNKTAAQLNRFQPDKHKAKLTAREIEILKLIADGNSNKEIGEKLFISHRTVDTHRTNLMKKLEVSNIAGLIRYAIQQGFVS